MKGGTSFTRLFEPGTIGRMQVRNRIVMPAMGSNYAAADGYASEQLNAYYEARARGGAGLIIVENCCVDYPRGSATVRQLAVSDDKYIAGLTGLARAIKKHGAKAALQLQHAGPAANTSVSGLQPVAPSAGAVNTTVSHAESVGSAKTAPRELTVAEIGDLVERFAAAARRARDAGFDAVEIHGAHRYLISSFLSRAWNTRADGYGGPLEGRARFLLEVFHAVRETVGKSFPVWCRINGEEEGLPGGTRLSDAQALAVMLEKEGVDALHISAAARGAPASRPAFYPAGWGIRLAAGVKQVVRIPVITVGSMTPELAEQALAEKKADFVAFGRALRVDPELPNKLALGCAEDIRPCILCNDCLSRLRPDHSNLCAVNAEIGREREYAIVPAMKKRRVLVAGGGPAGMEAAIVAAQRGHEVTLYEKSDRPGGKLLLAAAPPHKGKIGKLADHLRGQAAKLGVRIELGAEVDAALVNKLNPDVLVLAVGAKPIRPPISGIEKAVCAGDILSGREKTADKVAILGGGQVGCETAVFLAEDGGKTITVVEMLDRMAGDMTEQQGRGLLLALLKDKGVILLTGLKAEAITDKGIAVIDANGQKRNIDADTVVLACGYAPDIAFVNSLKGLVPEIHIAGDGVRARTILEAIDDGARIGRMI